MRKEDRKKKDPGTHNSLTLDIELSCHFAGRAHLKLVLTILTNNKNASDLTGVFKVRVDAECLIGS